MAHFARIENGIVTNIIVIDNENEAIAQKYIKDLGLEGNWLRTSYNGNICGKYAGIGYAYDEVNDMFVSPEPIEVIEVLDEVVPGEIVDEVLVIE